MVRPRCWRIISELPKVIFFKPYGANAQPWKEEILSIEELEAIKLKDYLNHKEIEAAEKMGISQPTFNRVYREAKRKLTKALVEGLTIKIKGGEFIMPNLDGTGPLGKGPKTGRGLGRCQGNGTGLRPGFGRGLGFRRGRCRGFGWRAAAMFQQIEQRERRVEEATEEKNNSEDSNPQ